MTSSALMPEPAGQRFQLPDGRRLPDIEQAEQDEGGEVALPVQRAGAGQRDPLPDHFVDDDDPGSFSS